MSDRDEVLRELLERLAKVISANRPVVNALAGAFIAEGREFARTPEGRRCRAALERSDVLPRARLLWEAFGLREARPTVAPPPSRWIGAAVAASASARLEPMLSSLLVAQVGKDPGAA